MSVNIFEVQDEAQCAGWDDYVLRHPQATGYHLVGWRRVIEEAFGHRTVYLMATDRHHAVTGVLPLAMICSQLFGRFLVSLPFVNYGGVLADTNEARTELTTAAVRVAERANLEHVELRHREQTDIPWTCKQHKVSMVLELTNGFDTLWQGFPSKLRSQIRRARKEGMTAQVGGPEMLAAFYGVFSRCMRDLGTPVYGRAFFDAVFRWFPKDVRICTVDFSGVTVAAGIMYSFRNRVEIPWAASDRRFNRMAPNMLLYSSMLESACREGFASFDFGRSTPDTGTYRFKEQWGARPVALHWYYWLDANRPLPDLSPRNPKHQLAIAIWRRLPLAVSNTLGPSIVKYIP